MSLLIGSVVAFVFVDAWWLRLLIVLPLVAVEAVEIALYMKLRNKRAITGAEALTGRKGTAITAVAPRGQVKIGGRLWRAESSTPIEVGNAIVVDGIDGLTLLVSPSPDQQDAASEARGTRR